MAPALTLQEATLWLGDLAENGKDKLSSRESSNHPLWITDVVKFRVSSIIVIY